MIPNTRDNNEIVRKLERILGTCSNIRDEIEIIIKKNNTEEDKSIISEDINRIAGNLNSVMKSTEPFFRYYLIIPNTTERDDSIIVMI